MGEAPHKVPTVIVGELPAPVGGEPHDEPVELGSRQVGMRVVKGPPRLPRLFDIPLEAELDGILTQDVG